MCIRDRDRCINLEKGAKGGTVLVQRKPTEEVNQKRRSVISPLLRCGASMPIGFCHELSCQVHLFWFSANPPRKLIKSGEEASSSTGQLFCGCFRLARLASQLCAVLGLQRAGLLQAAVALGPDLRCQTVQEVHRCNVGKCARWRDRADSAHFAGGGRPAAAGAAPRDVADARLIRWRTCSGAESAVSLRERSLARRLT